MRCIIVFIVSFCSIFCSFCSGYDRIKPTEFFRIDSAKSDKGIYEVFVVSNPPRDTLLLQKFVENYNLRTIPVNKIKRYERYTRVFYRESEFLTRNYKEGARDLNPRSPYTYQDLSNFSDNQLMNTRYIKWNDNTYRYFYYFKRKLENKQTIIIHDLDSFYHAKWIETADIDTTMIK